MTQGPLPIILLAAREYPDIEFRKKLWAILEDWLKEKSPRFDECQATSLLKQQTGTFIEPFNVTAEDEKLATFLIRLALSEEINASRFRIVGEDTIGNDGGAVFTRKGKSFYSERYALGKNKLNNSYVQFFAPGMKIRPPARTDTGKIAPAHMEATEEGVFIHLDSASFEQLDWISEAEINEFRSLARGLSSESVLGDKDIPIEEFGLSIQAGDKGIKIGSKSPESLIRLSAYIVKGSRITLKGVGSYELVIQIPKSGSGDADCLIVAQDGFALEWMDVSGFGTPAINDEYVKKISEWALPHADWTEQAIKGET